MRPLKKSSRSLPRPPDALYIKRLEAEVTRLRMERDPYIDVMPEWATSRGGPEWAYLAKRFAEDRREWKQRARRAEAELEELRLAQERQEDGPS